MILKIQTQKNNRDLPSGLNYIFNMKLNYSLIQFFKSTATVFTISGIVGLSFFLSGKSFWPIFLISAGIQYVLFSFVGNLITNYLDYQTKIKELDKIEPLSTILECAVCKTPNVITFVADQNERFEFICEKENCASKNVVSINFSVARVTEFKDPISPGIKI